MAIERWNVGYLPGAWSIPRLIAFGPFLRLQRNCQTSISEVIYYLIRSRTLRVDLLR